MKSMEPFYKIAQVGRTITGVFGSPAQVEQTQQQTRAAQYGSPSQLVQRAWQRVSPQNRAILSELSRRPYWANVQRQAYGRPLAGVHSMAAGAYRAGGGQKPYFSLTDPQSGAPTSRYIETRELYPQRARTFQGDVAREMFQAGQQEQQSRIHGAVTGIGEAIHSGIKRIPRLFESTPQSRQALQRFLQAQRGRTLRRQLAWDDAKRRAAMKREGLRYTLPAALHRLRRRPINLRGKYGALQ